MARKVANKGLAAPHFRNEGLAFLRGLVRANRRDPVEARDWFNERKTVYEEELKAPMLAIIQHVTDAMTDFAPDFVRPANKSLFRIYRDTRFANDKRPYKDHIAAWWAHTGLNKTSGAGFYFHVSGKEVTIAAGVYMPEKDQLASIRHWLLDNHREFRKQLEKPAVRTVFEEFEGQPLSRTPKGFPQNHPADDLIRCRQWGLAATLPVEASLDPKFATSLIRYFKLATPVVSALNTPLVASMEGSLKVRKHVIFELPDGRKAAKTR